MDSKGILWVYNGGTLNSATANKGYIGISAGGVATDIVENGGRVYIVEDWGGRKCERYIQAEFVLRPCFE